MRPRNNLGLVPKSEFRLRNVAMGGGLDFFESVRIEDITSLKEIEAAMRG